MAHKEWSFDSVPDSFWARIEAAHGDSEKFRGSLADASRELRVALRHRRADYRKVRDDPSQTPRTRQLRGPSFASMIVREYRKRFGEAIT